MIEGQFFSRNESVTKRSYIKQIRRSNNVKVVGHRVATETATLAKKLGQRKN